MIPVEVFQVKKDKFRSATSIAAVAFSMGLSVQIDLNFCNARRVCRPGIHCGRRIVE